MPALKNIITEELKTKIKELFDQELGSRQIAKRLGITRDFVQKIYKALGIYNSDRQQPRRVYKQKEKQCKTCNQILSIDNFRKRIGKYSDGYERISYEPYCKSCEYEKSKVRLNKRAKILRQTDLNFILRKSISFAMWRTLKDNCSSKNGNSCLDFLPYTIEELRAHLESQFEWWMTWDNYGVYSAKTYKENDPSTWTWQIDHIIPQSDLPYQSMEDENFKICWALSNLRPYSSKQNVLDGIRRTRHKSTVL